MTPGRTAEIFIAGVGLSPGYWRDQAKTEAAFLTDPDSGERIYRTGDLGSVSDGGLYFCAGRIDSQIKHRGYRIELAEVEIALNALDELRECAVVAVETDGFEANSICCAYVPNDAALEPPRLRAALALSLPSYMVPTRWQAYEALPKNANGKVDRPALRAGFLATGPRPGPVQADASR